MDDIENARMDHRHGEAWGQIGDKDYPVFVGKPRASFDTRNLRWLVYGPAIAAVVAWAVVEWVR